MANQSSGCMLELSFDIRSTTLMSCSKPSSAGQRLTSSLPESFGRRPSSEGAEAMVPPVVKSVNFMVSLQNIIILQGIFAG